jgi:hypothetical protein
MARGASSAPTFCVALLVVILMTSSFALGASHASQPRRLLNDIQENGRVTTVGDLIKARTELNCGSDYTRRDDCIYQNANQAFNEIQDLQDNFGGIVGQAVSQEAQRLNEEASGGK